MSFILQVLQSLGCWAFVDSYALCSLCISNTIANVLPYRSICHAESISLRLLAQEPQERPCSSVVSNQASLELSCSRLFCLSTATGTFFVTTPPGADGLRNGSDKFNFPGSMSHAADTVQNPCGATMVTSREVLWPGLDKEKDERQPVISIGGIRKRAVSAPPLFGSASSNCMLSASSGVLRISYPSEVWY